jgi:hypothetical protein
MITAALLAALSIGGCGGQRAVQADHGHDVFDDPQSFCRGPSKVAFDDDAPSYPDTVTPHWTVVSGPASPEGGIAVSSRVWVELFKASTWDWMNEVGITVPADLQTPLRVDLAELPSSWTAWIEHGLQRTSPDVDKPYSSARGHLFDGWLELHGSIYDGAELSLCAAATRGDGSTIKIHVPPIRFWLR